MTALRAGVACFRTVAGRRNRPTLGNPNDVVVGGWSSLLSSNSCQYNNHTTRGYYTNTDTMKRDDPYAQLGLQYGDGATLTEIKTAYKQKALQLHPDLQQQKQQLTESQRKSLERQFHELQKAYQTLIKVHSNLQGMSQEKDDEWRVSIWRNGDRIAINRHDVAGVARKRPIPAASFNDTAKHKALLTIGHPSGKGVVSGNTKTMDEYLDSGLEQGGSSAKPQRVSSSVGRGQSKWVKPKAYQSWKGPSSSIKASMSTKQTQSQPAAVDTTQTTKD